MSLDHIPGLGSIAPLAHSRLRRSWLRLTMLALAMLACVGVGFALGRYFDQVLGWVAHVAPGWHP